MAGRRGERWRALVAAAVAATVAGLGFWVFGSRLLAGAPRPPTVSRLVAPADPGGGEPDPANLVAVARLQERVDRPGAVLTVPGDAGRLVLPPGAVTAPVEVRAVLLAAAEDGSLVLDLQPDGLQLAEPARLELAVPPGLAPEQAEIVRFDPAGGQWVPEEVQEIAPDGGRIAATITHFSLRRLRLRPGLAVPYDPKAARGAPFLVTDPDNTFELLAEGRWQTVNRKTPAYRELLKTGRLGRHDLIASGRLRAVAGAAILSDSDRLVGLPAAAREGQSGWVRLVRLDERGNPTGQSTLARVVPLEETPGVVRLSRATLAALGVTWTREAGLGPDGERTFLRVRTGTDGPPLNYLPLRIEPAPAP